MRNPAAFCGVVGLRTTPGLVPAGNFDPLPVVGPMAQNAGDAALLFARPVRVGLRPPMAQRDRPADFLGLRPAPAARAAGSPGHKTSVTCRWSPRCGRPWKKQARAALRRPRAGGDRRGAAPDRRGQGVPGAARRLDGALGAHAPRRARVAQVHAGLEHLPGSRARRRADRSRHASGIGRSSSGSRRSSRTVATICWRCPPRRWRRSTWSRRWVTEIEGEQMPTYIDWMRSCSRIHCDPAPGHLRSPARITRVRPTLSASNWSAGTARTSRCCG